MNQKQLRKLYHLAIKSNECQKYQIISEQQCNSLENTKINDDKNDRKNGSVQQLKKLLNINHGVKNVIRMENMLNMQASIHKRMKRFQRGMSPKSSKSPYSQQPYPRNKKSLTTILPDLKKISGNNLQEKSVKEKVKQVRLKRQYNNEEKVKQRKKKLFKSQSQNKKQELQHLLMLPQYEKLIDDYVQKIKEQNLLQKYKNKQDLVKDACQKIQYQMQKLKQHDQIINYKSIEKQRSKADLLQQKSNGNIKKHSSSLPKQYSNHYLNFQRENIKADQIPNLFRKSKRPSLNFIMNATYMQDIEIIKRNQILQSKRRQRQQRVFLRKMKMLGLYKSNTSVMD